MFKILWVIFILTAVVVVCGWGIPINDLCMVSFGTVAILVCAFWPIILLFIAWIIVYKFKLFD